LQGQRQCSAARAKPKRPVMPTIRESGIGALESSLMPPGSSQRRLALHCKIISALRVVSDPDHAARGAPSRTSPLTELFVVSLADATERRAAFSDRARDAA